MSDRSSPVIFSEFFNLLAADPTDQHLAWARKLWKLSGQYDFCDNQLYCDAALVVLGLAKRVPPSAEQPYEGFEYEKR